MTERALRRWLALVHAVLVEERAAEEMGALSAELAALGQAQAARALREAARERRVRAMRWRAHAAALAR